MRAERYPWREISARMGCDRTTAWRRWEAYLNDLREKLRNQRKPQTRNLYHLVV